MFVNTTPRSPFAQSKRRQQHETECREKKRPAPHLVPSAVRQGLSLRQGLALVPSIDVNQEQQRCPDGHILQSLRAASRQRESSMYERMENAPPCRAPCRVLLCRDSRLAAFGA